MQSNMPAVSRNDAALIRKSEDFFVQKAKKFTTLCSMIQGAELFNQFVREEH